MGLSGPHLGALEHANSPPALAPGTEVQMGHCPFTNTNALGCLSFSLVLSSHLFPDTVRFRFSCTGTHLGLILQIPSWYFELHSGTSTRGEMYSHYLRSLPYRGGSICSGQGHHKVMVVVALWSSLSCHSHWGWLETENPIKKERECHRSEQTWPQEMRFHPL